jgi:hypothetical protein
LLVFGTKLEKKAQTFENHEDFFPKTSSKCKFYLFLHHKLLKGSNTMADDLKSNWKKVGKDWASLGTDLGKSLLKTMKTGVREATKWADEDDKNKEAEAKAEEAQAEEPKAEATEEPKAEEK